MIKLSADAGADFIKNSTGFAAGLTDDPYDHRSALAFRQIVPKAVGVKIVADGAAERQLEELVAAGVERLALGHPLR